MASKSQSSYEKDFYAWTLQSAKLIRQGRFNEIDAEHIAEELIDMGKNNKRELLSRLAVLLAHLLKWKFQSIRRSKSWIFTIKNQRLDINPLIKIAYLINLITCYRHILD